MFFPFTMQLQQVGDRRDLAYFLTSMRVPDAPKGWSKASFKSAPSPPQKWLGMHKIGIVLTWEYSSYKHVDYATTFG